MTLVRMGKPWSEVIRLTGEVWAGLGLQVARIGIHTTAAGPGVGDRGSARGSAAGEVVGVGEAKSSKYSLVEVALDIAGLAGE